MHPTVTICITGEEKHLTYKHTRESYRTDLHWDS